MLNTGNETVQFLKAPDSRKVHENVWWAKLRTADVPDKMSDELITRILTNYSFEDPDGRLVDSTVRQIVQVSVRMTPAPSADQWKVTISGLLKTL